MYIYTMSTQAACSESSTTAEQQQQLSVFTQDAFRHSTAVQVTCALAALRASYIVTLATRVKWKKIVLICVS